MSSPQISFYAHKGNGPNPLKVGILLEKLGLNYQVVDLDFGNDPERGVKSEKFLKINPNGRVPALVDHSNNDFTVWESGAILYYLSEKYDKEGKFLGKTVEEKSKVLQWVTFQMSGLGPVQGNLNYYYHYWKKTYGVEADKSVLTRFEGESYRLYKVLEDQLAEQEKDGSKYIVLDRPTIADYSFYTWVNIAGFAKLDLSPYPHVTKWLENLKDDKDIEKANNKIPK